MPCVVTASDLISKWYFSDVITKIVWLAPSIVLWSCLDHEFTLQGLDRSKNCTQRIPYWAAGQYLLITTIKPPHLPPLHNGHLFVPAHGPYIHS